ncbi:hypothetical protein MMC30_001277 [Trapelia coarctata]|nr:hypothetical protein [Trapelia coarctata]
MSMPFPYTYYSCPCSDTSNSAQAIGVTAPSQQEDEENEGKTFDPRSPRANFSLFPLDCLLWCEDCHDVKCERCTVEEILCWYCPNCLFETPSGMVKSDGNRCSRNCFNCPTCTAPVIVRTLDPVPGGISGPWILECDYCSWSTLDIGIKFDKVTNLFAQVAKLRQGKSGQKAKSSCRATEVDLSVSTSQNREPEAHFASLKAFYSSQLSKTSSSNPLLSPTGDINYNSPSSLARIMNLYTNVGTYGKKATTKTSSMRESADIIEGLQLVSQKTDAATIAKLRDAGWAGTSSIAQRSEQVHPSRFIDQLLPVPTLLRTRRSMRCRTCRHILVKPESKVQSTRYKIKLVATHYLPRVLLRPLYSSPSTPRIDLDALPPSKPIQFMLRVQNNMFDPIKVTLATPAQTPGRYASKVTILCPQFDVGPNTDVWDEALSGTQDKARCSMIGARGRADTEGDVKVAEAGKIWDKGRNMTIVILEVVCARIPGGGQQKKPPVPGDWDAGKKEEAEEELHEDEDILEIPVFVRAEYEVDVAGDEAGAKESKETKEKRELNYWCVLGVGRIAKSAV